MPICNSGFHYTTLYKDVSASTYQKIDHQDKDGKSALMGAVFDGNLEKTQELIRQDADVNLEDNRGWTALTYAALNDNSEIINLLIENNAIVKRDNFGRTVLTIAVINGCLNSVKELVYVTNIDLQDNEGKTALMHAALFDNTNIVKELINAGSNLTLEDNEGKTALMLSAQSGNKKNTKILLNHSYGSENDTWTQEIENEDIAEIFEDGRQKNNIMIKKIEEVVSKEITRVCCSIHPDQPEEAVVIENIIDKIPFEKVEEQFVQETFEERLYKLEQDQQTKEKEIEDKIEKFSEKLKKVKDKTDVVYEKYQRKLELLNEQKKLYFNPSIRTFYFTIQALFEVRLVAMMFLLGRILKREESYTEKAIGGVTEVAAGGFEVIPVAGPMISSGITLSVREVLSKMGDDIKIAQAKRIQKSLGNPKGASKYAEYAARKVAQKYEEIIRSKKVNIEKAKSAGEKVAKWMFKVVNDERNSVFDFFFVNNVLLRVVEERHKKNNLFEEKKNTEKKASKAAKKQVVELSKNQENLQKDVELLKNQQREFKITSLEQPIVEQFNAMIKNDFPVSKKTENVFEIILNKKLLTLKLCDDRKLDYLIKLTKYSTLFSSDIIDDWEIKNKSIKITLRYSHLAQDLKAFFEKSNVPVKR